VRVSVDLEVLVARAANGDETAWRELWMTVEPRLLRIIAQPRFLGPLGADEDDRRNVIVDVMAKLRGAGFARLRQYLEARAASPQLAFEPWLCVVAKRVGIDYLRAHPHYRRRYDEGRSKPGTWVRHTALTSVMVHRRPPMTNQIAARRLVERLALPPVQRRALELWAHGGELDDIARELELNDARAAHRTVRAALDRLRRAHRF
jgi:DNA-directed RNA polymerase specialized sigma24 family protein